MAVMAYMGVHNQLSGLFTLRLPDFGPYSFQAKFCTYIPTRSLFTPYDQNIRARQPILKISTIAIMHAILFLGTICAVAFAAPVAHSLETRAEVDSTWQPAEGTATSCDSASDKIIGFYVGPQIESVLTDACAAMMPPCAYPSRLPEDAVCVQVIDWRLDGPKNSTQSANIETLDGNKISGWGVRCTLLNSVVTFLHLLTFPVSVTPAAQPESSPGVFWTAQDCYGYFAHMLQESEPAGCHTSQGFGIGSITVGGDTSLAGTVLKVEIVAEQ